jgi:hypothetical protein
MDEEEIVAGTDPVVTPEPHKEPEYSEIEKQAMAQGWVPEDQFTGHGKWRTAENFLDRGELFAKIDEQNRRLKAGEQTTQALKAHLEKVRKTEYARALADLRAEKKAALIEGDADAVINAEEKIDSLKEEQRQEEQREAIVARDNAPAQEPPEVIAWKARNSWYTTDQAMKIYADQVGHELVLKGMMSPEAVLAEVERRTRKEFADRFVNPNRAKAGAVEGGGSKGGHTTKDSIQLTDEETRVMNRFVKAGVLTKEEYMADIKASRGV